MALLMTILCACGRTDFSITFELGGDVDADYRLLYYSASADGGRWVESAATVHQGKFKAEGVSERPAVVYVSEASSRLPQTVLYVIGGDDIIIKGAEASPFSWTITGNSVMDRLNDWQRANQRALASGDRREINKAVDSFVSKNPAAEAAPVILCAYYDRSADASGFARLWNLLPEETRKNDITSLFPFTDLLSGSILTSVADAAMDVATGKTVPVAIPLRIKGNIKDTLRLTAGVNLIMFYHTGDVDRHVFIDTLRRLEKDYPDTTRLRMADICLDYDSIRWKYNTPKDSLRHTLRGWWPEGECHPYADSLGATRRHNFVVADPKGRLLYCGSDVKEAAAAVRKNLR